MDIKTVGLGHILANHSLAVPIYQRSYAWKDTHVLKLLTDVKRAMNRRAEGRTSPYFLGSIVVISRPGSTRLEVVDGQQRLATVSLFIAAIRDHLLAASDEELAGEYERAYLRSLETEPVRQWNPKLALNEIDNECYKKCILDRPKARTTKRKEWNAPSHKRLFGAEGMAIQTANELICNAILGQHRNVRQTKCELRTNPPGG